jgi:hypothetical protein
VKSRLLIIYDYFYPGFKAGGPIQSLTNLIVTLENIYSISVITSAYDLFSDKPYRQIQPNSWNEVALPGSKISIQVWYSAKKPATKNLKWIINQLRPQTIYLNGIFSYRFFITPLRISVGLSYCPRVVVCPRGMLQEGALHTKRLKKQIYLKALQTSGLLSKIIWHANNLSEADDIKKTFKPRNSILIAQNVPKQPGKSFILPSKQAGGLKLTYISLITEKKNLLFTIDIIRQCKGVTLDIYGPIKDLNYWHKCKELIRMTSGRINYKGEIEHTKVLNIFSGYDASILMTRGENFGHALYESLSAGRPIITSKFTPWINLQQQKAGWNTDISASNEAINLLNNLRDMESNIFNEFCAGAHDLATKYYSGLNSVEAYTRLFN